MATEMTEELVRLLNVAQPENRSAFVTLAQAWLASSASRSQMDGELHMERLKMTRGMTRTIVDLLVVDSQVCPPKRSLSSALI